MGCNSDGKSGICLSVTILLIFLSTLVYSQQIGAPGLFHLASPVPDRQVVDPDKINSILTTETPVKKKSAGKAFFYSLLIPGLGEAYTGHTGYTRFFLCTEGIGWGFFLANNLQVNARTEDYENYALQHAGITRSNKDAQYWIDIGKYNTIYEYNEQKRRERDVESIYPENTDYFWRWDTYPNRLYYDGERIQTREIEQRQVYIIGALVLNHVLSAINALRLARAYNTEAGLTGWKMDVSVHTRYSAISLNFSRVF
jgi:hypothetical protein